MGLDLNYQPDVIVEDIGLLTEEEWLDYRRKGIGGSDAGVLYGLSKYKTEKDLWLDKTGRLPSEKDTISSWLAKEYGHYLEELVAMTFAKVTGYRVFKVPKMFRHPLYPYMQADVDYFVEMPDGRIFVLECKTCHPEKLLDAWGTTNENKVPAVYEWQGRHYMAVCNVDGVFFACLAFNCIDGFRWRFLERDLELEEDLIMTEGRFWNKVQLDIEPDYTTESTDAIMRSLLRRIQTKDETVDLPGKFVDVILEYQRLDEERKATNRKADELKDKQTDLLLPIIEHLNGKTGLITVGKKKLKIYQKKSNRVSVKKENLQLLKHEHPDLYDRYATVSDSQTFAVEKAA